MYCQWTKVGREPENKSTHSVVNVNQNPACLLSHLRSNLWANFWLWGHAFHMHCDSYMKWDVRYTFSPELYIKTTCYVNTVTSHCVSCKHVTRTIARTVWVLFCTCVITDSILVDLYPPFRRHSHTWMHTLMHMYTQPHTHARATHKYPCTFTNTTPHTHTHI